MDLLLIVGVSGSGKSVAMAALEDSGYYGVTNLPLTQLAGLLAHLKATQQEHVAILLDVKTEPKVTGIASIRCVRPVFVTSASSRSRAPSAADSAASAGNSSSLVVSAAAT